MANNPFPDQYRWDIFDDTDGLGHQAFCLLQHSDGYLWIATAEGLFRYDGRRFVSYAREVGISGHILALCEDRSGNLWLGTSLGLACFDGRTARLFKPELDLRRFVVRSVLANDDGTILCGSDVSGAFLFDGEKFRSISGDTGSRTRRALALFRDSYGRTWLGTEAGLAEVKGRGYEVAAIREGIAGKIVLAINQDASGRLWYGTEGGGLACLGQGGVVTYTAGEGLPDNNVMALLPYKGGMMCATSTGLCWFDGSRFMRFGIQPGPAGTSVTAMALDREGGLWVANDHAGIARYNGDQLAVLSSRGTLEAIMQDKSGGLWWGGNGILCHRTADGLVCESRAPQGRVNAIVEDRQGRFWIGTSQGVLVSGGGGGTADRLSFAAVPAVDQPEGNPFVWRIHEDRRGDLWVGAIGGVYRYDRGQLRKVFEHNLVSVLYEDGAGVLWIAGWGGGGVAGWDGNCWIPFPGADKLPSDHVTAMLEDGSGRLWIGLSVGLCCFENGSVRTYTTRDGLSGDFVQRLMLDRAGRLWVGHLGGGISIFDGRNFQTISKRDGLPSNGVTGLLAQDDGSVIIGTYKGLCRYAPSPVPPLIRIDYVDADREYTSPEEVTISTAVPAIHIRFSGISFTTRQLRYRHTLEGRDDSWMVESAEEVRYSGLAEGSYVFKVAAVSRDLVCSEKPAELRIKVVKDPRDSRLDQLTREVQEQSASLKAERELMDRVMHAMTDSIMIVNHEGTVRGANGATRMLLGYAEDEIVGLSIERVLLESRGGQFKPLFGHGLVRNVEMTYLSKDGVAFPVVLSSVVLGESDKEVILVARESSASGDMDKGLQGSTYFSDALAKLERAEEEMIRNERLRALGEMSSGVAHDFNNALVPVLGYADILIHEPETLRDTAAALEMLKAIYRAAEDAAQVVQNLRSFYTSTAREQYERINLNALAKEVIALTRPRWKEEMSAKGVTIRVESDFSGAPVAKGNAAQLRTALTNLIFNSIEAMPKGGVITISTAEGGLYHSIEVRDTGAGMTEEVRRRCFEPFFTTHNRHGSGLGLAMVYGIIRRHGGSIEARSVPGRGTEMKIRLPATVAAGKLEQAGPVERAVPAHLRILVVDDEEACLSVIAHFLRADGHSFELAAGGKEALEKFRAGGFDVVLTDRAMPNMSGDVVAAEIRRLSPNTPVIMMTGFGSILLDEKHSPEGVDLILSKPITRADLRRVLSDLHRA